MAVKILTKNAKAARAQMVDDLLSQVPADQDEKVQALMRRIASTAELTDEEILAKVKPAPGRRGRPAGQTDEDVMDKMLAVYRLRIRGLSIKDISVQLNCSETSASNLVKKVEAALRVDVKQLDVPSFIGDSLAFYKELRGMALLMTASQKATAGQKLYAMRVALAVEDSKNKFLEQVGVYSPVIQRRVERLVGTTFVGGEDEGKEAEVDMGHELGRLFLRDGLDRAQGMGDAEPA